MDFRFVDRMADCSTDKLTDYVINYFWEMLFYYKNDHITDLLHNLLHN